MPGVDGDNTPSSASSSGSEPTIVLASADETIEARLSKRPCRRDAAKKLNPEYQGPKAGDIQTAIGNAMQRVEQGKQNGEDSWRQFVGDVQK